MAPCGLEVCEWLSLGLARHHGMSLDRVMSLLLRHVTVTPLAALLCVSALYVLGRRKRRRVARLLSSSERQREQEEGGGIYDNVLSC